MSDRDSALNTNTADRLFFVGGGSLLTRAVLTVQDLGFKHTTVYCPVDDPCIPKLRKLNVEITQTHDPSTDILRNLEHRNKNIILSINNKHVFSDEVLSCSASFFNIHNGLVQNYRGISEVCVFAALVQGAKEYGVTLHRILPNQKVDTGPIIAQEAFPISAHDTFFDVMQKSMHHTIKIFDLNIKKLIANNFETTVCKYEATALKYEDIPSLLNASTADILIKARSMGYYEPYFQKLANLIDKRCLSKR